MRGMPFDSIEFETAASTLTKARGKGARDGEGPERFEGLEGGRGSGPKPERVR
jgi:hypothetical protein